MEPLAKVASPSHRRGLRTWSCALLSPAAPFEPRASSRSERRRGSAGHRLRWATKHRRRGSRTDAEAERPLGVPLTHRDATGPPSPVSPPPPPATGIVEAVDRVVVLQAEVPVSSYLVLWNRLCPSMRRCSTERSPPTRSSRRPRRARPSTPSTPRTTRRSTRRRASLRAARAGRHPIHRRRAIDRGGRRPRAAALPTLAAALEREHRGLAGRAAGCPAPAGRVVGAPAVRAVRARHPPGARGRSGRGRRSSRRAICAGRGRRDVPPAPRRALSRGVRTSDGRRRRAVLDGHAWPRSGGGRGAGRRARDPRGADGAVLLDVPDGELPGEGTPAPPRLMAMWDSTLLAYADRARSSRPTCAVT